MGLFQAFAWARAELFGAGCRAVWTWLRLVGGGGRTKKSRGGACGTSLGAVEIAVGDPAAQLDRAEARALDALTGSLVGEGVRVFVAAEVDVGRQPADPDFARLGLPVFGPNGLHLCCA